MKWTILEVDEDLTPISVMEIPTGYLVKRNEQLTFVSDSEHISFDLALPEEVPVEPAPEPTPVDPTPTPEPDPIPVEPAPEPTPDPDPIPVVPAPTEEYQVIYDDGMRNGWANYSWAATDELNPESFEGQFAMLVDADNWDALNFNKDAGFNTSEYTEIEFAIKAKGDGTQDIILALSLNYETLGFVSLASLFAEGVLPTAEYKTVRVKFADLGVENELITNLLFQGNSGGAREPFLIDSVKLVKAAGSTEPAPEPAPDPTPVEPGPAPAPTEGWLYTEANKILNSDGTVWQGRGANLMDTRGCWSCAWSEPDVAEVKRRADELMNWGSDFIRLCMETDPDAGVQNKNALTDSQYLANIKEIVDYIGSKGGRVLLSVWVDPTLSGEGWPTAQTNELLKVVTEAFLNAPHVMFGVSNEPEYNFDGSQDAQVHAAMTAAVQAIREVEDAAGTPHHIVSVSI